MTKRRIRFAVGSRRRMALALLVTWLAAQIVIAWAPFRFDPPKLADNGAQYLASGTLSFSGAPAHARAEPPLSWDTADEVDVDLTFQTERSEQFGPARLLTVARDHRASNLVIGQEGADLVIRVRHPGGDGLGRQHVHVQNVFAQSGWQHVRVEISDTVRVSVNGEQVADHGLSPDTFSAWDTSYPMTLGDAVIGDRPWDGLISEARLTTEGRSYDLLEPGLLDVPDRFLYVPSRLREAVHWPNTTDAFHSVLHLIAWIPAGAALATLLRPRRRRWRVAALACGIALLLQIGKIAIAARHPSVLDVATQTTGALVGVWLAGFFHVSRDEMRKPSVTAAHQVRQEPAEVSEPRG